MDSKTDIYELFRDLGPAGIWLAVVAAIAKPEPIHGIGRWIGTTIHGVGQWFGSITQRIIDARIRRYDAQTARDQAIALALAQAEQGGQGTGGVPVSVRDTIAGSRQAVGTRATAPTPQGGVKTSEPIGDSVASGEPTGVRGDVAGEAEPYCSE